MPLTQVSIHRPVATSMAFLILIVLGIVSFRTLPIDLLPKVEFTQLTVRVGYPNVGPEEVEQIITDRIENAPYPHTPSRVVRHPVACSPCRRGCETAVCMRLISPHQVVAAARELLTGARCPEDLRTDDPLDAPPS